jgi:hypothetical protein
MLKPPKYYDSYQVIAYFSYLCINLLLTKWVTKVKPAINSNEDKHILQASSGWCALVGASSL